LKIITLAHRAIFLYIETTIIVRRNSWNPYCFYWPSWQAGISSTAGFYRFWELRPDSPEAVNSPCGRRTKKTRRKMNIRKPRPFWPGLKFWLCLHQMWDGLLYCRVSRIGL
jgi:hypothetical protein